MTLTYTIDRVQCSIALNNEEWGQLNSLDFLDTVNPVLVTAGALDNTIDYNEHFGSYLYFTADNNTRDAEEVTKAVQRLLDGCVKN